MKNTKQAILVLAAGVGSRMNAEKPKQFLTLQGRPLIYHTLNNLLSIGIDLDIYLVVQPEYVKEVQDIIQNNFDGESIGVLHGGKERFHSTQEALKQIPDYDFILIHDAARPFITRKLILDGLELVRQHPAVVPVVEVTDSMRQVKEDGKSEILDRKCLKSVQTPQFFQGNILKGVYERVTYNVMYSDDASVLEKAGYPVTLTKGDINNIKITYPLDLIIGEYLLENHSLS